MKRLITLLLTLSMGLMSQTPEPSFDFKGIKAGMEFQEFKTTYKPHWLSGLVNNLTFVGNPCSVQHNVSSNTQGVKIVNRFWVTGLPISEFSVIKEACVAKYGKPYSDETSTSQNGYGATFQQVTVMWKNSTSYIVLSRMMPIIDGTLSKDFSSIKYGLLSDLPSETEVKKVLSDL